MSLTLIETKVFTRKKRKLLNDERFKQFCEELASDPGIGDVMRGTGGLRKIRVSLQGRGKSGGARIIYFWAVSNDLVIQTAS